jgi:hypothetical protein
MGEKFEKIHEYELPVNEGPVYRPPADLKTLKPSEFPFENIGSLERGVLELSKWKHKIDEDGYGVAYRTGIKNGIRNPKGKLSKLIIIFGIPLRKQGVEDNEEKNRAQYNKLGGYLREKLIEASKTTPHLIGLVMYPPDYMLEELKEELPH